MYLSSDWAFCRLSEVLSGIVIDDMVSKSVVKSIVIGVAFYAIWRRSSGQDQCACCSAFIVVIRFLVIAMRQLFDWLQCQSGHSVMRYKLTRTEFEHIFSSSHVYILCVLSFCYDWLLLCVGSNACSAAISCPCTIYLSTTTNWAMISSRLITTLPMKYVSLT
jgi:hypothetical protein